MRFILFDSVIAKQCHIRQGWIRRQRRRVFPGVLHLLLRTTISAINISGLALTTSPEFASLEARSIYSPRYLQSSRASAIIAARF